jgi:NAD(P)-dependent dehydrogenase (short-subunit alcohol dehydrogenase family)
MEFKGKVAFITGGSRGIGESVARKLAKLGCNVVISARSEDALKKIAEDIKSNGGEASYVVCDAGKEDSIKSAIEFTEKTYGRLDLVFSNAGWEGPIGQTFDQMESANIQKLIDLHVVGPIFLVKYTAPLVKKNGGVFVFTSSLAAIGGAEFAKIPFGIQMYSVSKSSLLQLTKMMACYDKCSSFCILPAVVDTQMMKDITSHELMKALGMSSPVAMSAMNPVNKGKIATADQVADVVLTLFDGSTHWKNGDSIVVDGDVTMNAFEFMNVGLTGKPDPKMIKNYKGE